MKLSGDPFPDAELLLGGSGITFLVSGAVEGTVGSQEQEAAISPSEHFLQADDLRECNAMTMSDYK